MKKSLELLNSYLDGKELSPQEEQELAAWVNDPENAKAIVELAIIHSHTQHWMSVPNWFGGLGGTIDELEESMASLPLCKDCNEPAEPPVVVHRFPWVLAVAASLFFVLFAFQGNQWYEPTQPIATEVTASIPSLPESAVVATVTEAMEVLSDNHDIHCGTHIELLEQWVVDSGIVALTTEEGCRLVIEGPAEFRFDSSKQIFLKQGKLTARAEGGAAGLVVITPSAKVVDLGTEFGVAVGPELDTRVAVYEGAAELYGNEPPLGDSPASRRINAGRVGYVGGHGELLWTVQTLPCEREFIRPDEIESIRRARDGSAEATQQISYFALQRTPGLLAYQSFDIPSKGERYALSFMKNIRSKTPLVFAGDLRDNHLYSSGALVLDSGEEAILDLDTSSDSPLARAKLLTEQGQVGRSGTELWVAWKSQMVHPDQVGSYAGLGLMFGDQRMVQEPLFFGYSDNRTTLSAVLNLGSRTNHMELDSNPDTFAIDHLQLNNQVRQWVVQIIFGERSDKVAVWCDVPFANIRDTRPMLSRCIIESCSIGCNFG